MRPWVPLTIISAASLIISSGTLLLVYPLYQSTLPIDLVPQDIQNDTAKENFLMERVQHFFTAMETRNATDVHSFYYNSGDTSLGWHGQAEIYGGEYSYERIFLLYNTLLSHSLDIQMSFDNYNSSFVDDDRAIVELMVFSNGIHDSWGDFEFEASTKTNWEYVNDEWVIVEDIWEFQRWRWEITPFQP